MRAPPPRMQPLRPTAPAAHPKAHPMKGPSSPPAIAPLPDKLHNAWRSRFQYPATSFRREPGIRAGLVEECEPQAGRFLLPRQLDRQPRIHHPLREQKPLYQKLTSEVEKGFTFKSIQAPGFECPWHAHPEIELILVLKSQGYRIVGDSIAQLTAGDLVLVGANIPHIWQEEARANHAVNVHALLLQFEKQLLGDALLARPEMIEIRRLLDRAGRGLHFYGTTRNTVHKLMLQMERMDGFQRFINFLRILGELANSTEAEPLASPGFTPSSAEYDQERMNRVFGFINSQLDQAIRLKDAAKVVGLSEGAFSRFFRLHTGKTFPHFVNTLRIGRACRLLIESDKSITEISYECGFSTLSNFNRQFLRAKNANPRSFRNMIKGRL